MNRLCRAICRRRRALKREKHLTKIKESAETEKATEEIQSKHFNWSSIAKRENPETVLTSPLFNSCRPIGPHPSREDSGGSLVEAPESGLRWWSSDLNTEIEESTGQAEMRERITGPDPGRHLERTASGLSGKTGKIAVRDVLGHELLGRVDVLFDGDGTKSCGCNEPGQVQADRWIVRYEKVLGHIWLNSPLHPLRYEGVQTAFVPKTLADAGLFLLLRAAELSRALQKEIVVVQLDVKKAFDPVEHQAAFKAMRLQSLSPLSMALIAAIWSGCCMKVRLGTVLSNKVQMSRGLPQSLRSSSQ